MTNIVERLRAEAPTIFTEGHNIDDFDAIDAQRKEAADEIERLREQILALLHIADRDEQEIERLREEVIMLTKLLMR